MFSGLSLTVNSLFSSLIGPLGLTGLGATVATIINSTTDLVSEVNDPDGAIGGLLGDLGDTLGALDGLGGDLG